MKKIMTAVISIALFLFFATVPVKAQGVQVIVAVPQPQPVIVVAPRPQPVIVVSPQPRQVVVVRRHDNGKHKGHKSHKK
ncbi:MAG: hypothetical protein V4615_02825 [Bacteroidota bacterium]